METSKQITRGIETVCGSTRKSATATTVQIARRAIQQILPEKTCWFHVDRQLIDQAKAIALNNECVHKEIVNICGSTSNFFNGLGLFMSRHKPINESMKFYDWQNAFKEYRQLVVQDVYNLFATSAVQELTIQSPAAITWANADIMGYTESTITQTIVQESYNRLVREFTCK